MFVYPALGTTLASKRTQVLRSVCRSQKFPQYGLGCECQDQH